LLLDVLDALGDATARDDALAWAWWNGAPVERWLPDGPARRKVTGEPTVSNPPRSESLHPGMMQPVTDRTREPVGAAGGVPG
jgi:hypothetical protein